MLSVLEGDPTADAVSAGDENCGASVESSCSSLGSRLRALALATWRSGTSSGTARR